MNNNCSVMPAMRMPLLCTGIDGFDTIMGGGFPAHSLYLLQGLAGSGKTTLACQIGFLQARAGKKVLILTLIAETHGKILNHLSNFSFFEESLVGEKIVFYGAYSSLAEGGLRGLLTFIATRLAEQKPDLMIIDGFRSVRDSSPSDLALAEFMLAMNSLVSTMRCTTFLLSPTEGNVAESENTLVDGLIELSQHEQGLRLIREIKVYKLRGGKHLLGRHVFEVGEDGVVVYPRLEAVNSALPPLPSVSTARLSLGIDGLDRMTNGGVMQGSTTNLLGNPGSGKTLMGLHFIYQGLQLGQSGLILGFYESPAHLLEKAEAVGMYLRPFLDSGALEIIWQPPLEILVDSLAHGVLNNIARRGVARLLVDGVDGLREVVMHDGRARSFLAAFVNQLRHCAVSTLLTQELPYFGETHAAPAASMLFDNIILLRYVELGGVNRRQVGVLKLRENGYDAANHFLRISERGMAIEGPVAGLAA